MRKKDVVLLDLDGTVLDTGELILSSWRYVRDRFGIEADDDAFRRGMGRPLVEIFDGFSRDVTERAAFVDAYREHNLAVHDEMVKPFPGIPELFERLVAGGLRIGIVTSKLRAVAERGLRVAGLVVDDLVGPEDVSRPKPDAEPVTLAMSRLRTAPSRAIFVGDSPHDLLAGHAAGVEVAAVRWGMFALAELEAARPNHWLERPADLLQHVL
jgi:pyrophosphatase PpaX